MGAADKIGKSSPRSTGKSLHASSPKPATVLAMLEARSIHLRWAKPAEQDFKKPGDTEIRAKK